MRSLTLAFADEYGNNSFDFDTQGTHFVVSTILIKSEKISEAEQQVEVIRKKYFQNGEIKSSKVGNNTQRRKLILQSLANVDFKVHAIVVDKRKLYSDGFTYKKSFYKFICGIAYKELYKTFPKLTITVDEHGHNDFMRSFKKYIEANHIRDLFSGSEFVFSNSGSNILIQLADFIGGTIGRCYDTTKNDTNLEEYLNILKPNLTAIRFFPNEYKSLLHGEENEINTHDKTIAELATNLALDYVDNKEAKSTEDIHKISIVKLLLLYQSAFSHKVYITTNEIIKHLQSQSDKTISKQYFRTKLIGKLRDAGVLIASKSHGNEKGYKLPTKIKDIYDFINHGNAQIIPMINRIKICRDAIYKATHGEEDVLNKDAYSGLKSIIASVEEKQYLDYAKNKINK
jgi:hypothetical protein